MYFIISILTNTYLLENFMKKMVASMGGITSVLQTLAFRKNWLKITQLTVSVQFFKISLTVQKTADILFVQSWVLYIWPITMSIMSSI